MAQSKEEKHAKRKLYNEANKDARKVWREANKEEIAATSKAYYEANKEVLLAQAKARYEANKEEILAKQRSYNEANKENKAAYDKSYRESNKEKLKALSKNYYEATKEHRADYQKSYFRNNKASVYAKNAKRRALKRKQIPVHLRDCPHEKQRLVQTYKLRNILTEATGVQHHVDHMWPLADGGPHWSGNLQVIPAEENLSKNASVCEDTKATIIKSLYTFESDRAI